MWRQAVFPSTTGTKTYASLRSPVPPAKSADNSLGEVKQALIENLVLEQMEIVELYKFLWIMNRFLKYCLDDIRFKHGRHNACRLGRVHCKDNRCANRFSDSAQNRHRTVIRCWRVDSLDGLNRCAPVA